jgi:hypothetical protein
MPDLLNGRPYAKEKTGIDNLEKLKEVRNSLISQSNKDKLRGRAQNRRQFNPQQLSVPIVSKEPTTSDSPYRVNGYNPDTDQWNVQSVANPVDQFSAKAIKGGGIAIGSTVRGYAPQAIEQKPQGRRFKPVETETVIKKDIKITITIGYTGKR